MPRIEDKVGVSYRQLHHWTQLGYIKATQNGSGKNYHYPPLELRVARIIGHLVHLGFQPKPAAELARALADQNEGGSLELSNGKLRVTGSFAKALRKGIRRT